MIYTYEKTEKAGPFGNSVVHNNQEGEITQLGSIGNTVYLYVPDGLTLNQPEGLAITPTTLTAEEKSELKSQALVRLKKSDVRKKIELEVGDLHDLLADCMKMVEFNFVLTVSLAADYFGTSAMPADIRQRYADRNQATLDGIQSGDIKLRGSLEDADQMLADLMTKYSRIQSIVDAEYLSKLKELGL